MKPTQITFFGNFGTQNLGNECTLQAIIHHTLKRLPDAKIKCLCPVPKDTAERHHLSAFCSQAESPAWLRNWLRARRSRLAGDRNAPVSVQTGISGSPAASAGHGPEQVPNPPVQPGRSAPLVKWLRIIFRVPLELLHWAKGFMLVRGSSMLIVPGTGLVSDYLTGPFGWAYDIFKWSIIAKICRARVLFVSIGVGPVYHPLSKWFIKTSLRFADYRSYRDMASKQYMEGIGFCANGDRVCPDLAFGLPGSLFPEGSLGTERKPVIGVGLKDYYGPRGVGDQPDANAYRDYLDKMVAFVAWLQAHGYPVQILIGDILYDSGVKRDFMSLLKERGLAPGDRDLFSQPALTVGQLLRQIAATDIIISPRFHNLVLALMLNKPVIALSDHQKLDSLMAGFGLAEYCVPLRNLDVDTVVKQLTRLEGNAAKLKPHIKQKVEEYREALDREYSVIFPGEKA